MNPFAAWVEIARDLLEAVRTELGDTVVTPRMGEFLGSFAALVTRIDHMAVRLDQLAQREPENAEFIRRAIAGAAGRAETSNRSM